MCFVQSVYEQIYKTKCSPSQKVKFKFIPIINLRNLVNQASAPDPT